MKSFYPLIFIIAIVFIIVLSTNLMENNTGSNLEFLHDEPTLGLIRTVFPEASYFIVIQNNVYAVYDNVKDKIGYEFVTVGEGYGGDIRIQVGLEDENTIRGISITLHSEVFNAGTEYGEPLEFDPLIIQFEGLKIEDCFLD